MPNRIIRETILTSRAVNQLRPTTENFYRRLMSIVDDYGRFEADPEILVARLYPIQSWADNGGERRISADNCAQMLTECGRVLTTDGGPLVAVYKVKGRTYLQLNNFGQRTRTPSRYPDPSEGLVVVLRANDGECPPRVRTEPPARPHSESESETVRALASATAPATPDTFPESTPDELAASLVTECLNRPHWEQSDRGLSIRQAVLILTSATNPRIQRDAIAEMHAAHAEYFATAPRSARRKRLEWWLKDEDWMHPPPRATTTESRSMRLLREREAQNA